tara:strand:- start:136 stop:888 length:753 start_codon:yes stop_codon:yes gene_type:complete
MAKVKITGHASGSGVITVTAPNTSTDRTITLPDADVTLGAAVGGASGVDFNDDVKARFGTGNDLEVYHDGSNSYISDTGANGLIIKNDALILARGGNTEKYLEATANGAVDLYHNNNKKLETTAVGVTVTGATNSTVMPTLAGVAIAASGSNSNGAYTKWADGTMICTHKLVSSGSADVTWTYPVAFVSGNVPAFAGTNAGVSPDADGGRILTNAGHVRTNTYIKFHAYILANGGRSTSTFQMSAIGRWS